MTAYLYVLWAAEDELVKIGISKQLQKRLSAHTGNSSNPLEFRRWKLYQFAELRDAQRIEGLVLDRLANQGFSYRNKRELFKCSPTAVTGVIEDVCDEVHIAVTKNFPFDLLDTLETFRDFPCLPDHALELLTREQQKLYWKGVRDALYCISYLEGITISRPDFFRMSSELRIDEETYPEFWTTMIDHYRNRGSLGSNEHKSAAAKKIAWTALEKIKSDRHFAYIDWQGLDDDDEDLLTAEN